MARPTLEASLDALELMTADELRTQWKRLHKSEPPLVSNQLMALALGHELQCRALGKLSRSAREILSTAVGCSASRLTPVPSGARFVRSWQGKTYVVETGEDGIICWNNREWGSLSEVARAITGTRWSGPAFFGLRDRNAA